MRFTKIRPIGSLNLNELKEYVKKEGFDCWSDGESLRNFRIMPEIRGYNRGGYSYILQTENPFGRGPRKGDLKQPKRTRVLCWDDWVELNYLVNKFLDEKGIKCNVYTLGGKFRVRDFDKGAYTEDDWEDLAYENVGSAMVPVNRKDLYYNETKEESVYKRFDTEDQLRSDKSIEARAVPQGNLSAECWLVQFRGFEACKACDVKGTKECGGKNIIKTGKNENGMAVPLGRAI